MLLFPGESVLYRDKQGWQLRDAGKNELIICEGHCEREDRPLACRLFPLLPVDDVSGKAVMDARARYVCPLYSSGIMGMDAAFREAVADCGKRLMACPSTAAFLRELNEENRALKKLRKVWSGE